MLIAFFYVSLRPIKQRMMTTQFKTPTADLQHQYDLLQKEFEYEKEMYREQTERAGIHRRIQQGLCWYPVVPGKSYYNSLKGSWRTKRPNTILNMAVRSASSQQKEAGNLNT